MKRSSAPSQRALTAKQVKNESTFSPSPSNFAQSRLPESPGSSTSKTVHTFAQSTGPSSAFATPLPRPRSSLHNVKSVSSTAKMIQNPAKPMHQAHRAWSTSLKTVPVPVSVQTHTASPTGRLSVRGSGAARSACLTDREAAVATPGSVVANSSSFVQPSEPRYSTEPTPTIKSPEPLSKTTCTKLGNKPGNSMISTLTPGASSSVDSSNPEEEPDDMLSEAVDAARRGQKSILKAYLLQVRDSIEGKPSRKDLKDHQDNLVHLLVTATVYNQPTIVELLIQAGANPKSRGTPKINMEVSLDPKTVVQKSSFELNDLIRVMEPSSRKAKAVQTLLRADVQ